LGNSASHTGRYLDLQLILVDGRFFNEYRRMTGFETDEVDGSLSELILVDSLVLELMLGEDQF
jgi:hypothetical protein